MVKALACKQSFEDWLRENTGELDAYKPGEAPQWFIEFLRSIYEKDYLKGEQK